MELKKELAGFGEEFDTYTFKDALDWFVHVRDPREVFEAQPTYFISECAFIFIGLSTLFHSFIVGGRWKYHWLATVFHGLTTEMVAFWMPDIDNYWHSQTTIIFLGRRLPLHIILLYPTFMYNAAYMVAHMKLPRWAEPMAAGLTEVLIDIPYDIMCIKFIHWTWHDTDPNIYDRHYWVPWNSYYFHLTFGTAFTFALHFWRRKITGSDDKNRPSSPIKEILCAILAGFSGMPGGVLQFIILYHPLHDIFGIHTENCVITIIAFYLFIVWTADRMINTSARRQPVDTTHWSAWIIVMNMIIHYSIYFCMAFLGSPEKEVSIGLHEKIGPCNQTKDVQTVLGQTLQKRSYLCVTDYDEQYFDFHCLPGGKPPKEQSEWYTICGMPFVNRAEYTAMIGAICVVAFIVFHTLLFRSSRSLVPYKSKKPEPRKVDKKKKKN